MTDADVRKRCEEWLKNQGYLNYIEHADESMPHADDVNSLSILLLAAYADGQRDGMERARKIAGKYIMIPHIAEEIRQAAGEVTGE